MKPLLKYTPPKGLAFSSNGIKSWIVTTVGTGMYAYQTRGDNQHVSTYVMPISLNVGLVFH